MFSINRRLATKTVGALRSTTLVKKSTISASKCATLNPPKQLLSYFDFSTPFPLNHVSNQRSFSKQVSKEQLSKEGNPNDIALTMERVSKRLEGGRVLFDDISTAFYHGAKIGILGKNGAGKSSLLKAIAGRDPSIEGVIKTSDGKRIGFLAQEPELDETKNVLENIFDGVTEKKRLLDRYDEVCELFEDPEADIDALIEEQAELQAKIDDFDGWDLMRQVEISMEALGCPPGDSQVEHLSGGEKRRVALCRLLLSQPDILLLDEPTNHLDAGSVAWLEKFLQQYTGLVIAITHDRYFLDNVAGWILEIDNGRFIPFRGNYGQWLEARSRRIVSEDREAMNVKKNLDRELQFIAKGQRGQVSKGKARIRKVEDLQDQKESLRRTRVESGSLVIPQGPRLGNKVIQVSDLALAYNDDAGRGVIYTKDEVTPLLKEQGEDAVQWIFKNVNFDVSPGQIVGIVGPNGVGKTTLLKMILGEKFATMGEILMGSSVQYGYNAQTREKLSDDRMVWEEIAEGVDWVDLDEKTRLNVRTYVAQFNFCGSDQSKLIGKLSGGERNRVHLAKSLRKGANVILLDEPTNDLDVDTLRSLEDALNAFEGCAFVVSHDRWFLDRVCTDILAFYEMPDMSGEGTVVSSEYFFGNYSEFLDHFKSKHKRDFVDTRKKLKNMMNF